MDLKTPDEGLYAFGQFHLDPRARSLLRDGEPVPLTNRVFETLLVFLRNPGRVLGKDELMEAVWPGRYMEESSLKQAIFTLRKALGDDTQYIATAAGRGYSFTAPVQRIAASAASATGAIGSATSTEQSRVVQSTAAKPGRSFISIVALSGALLMLLAGAAAYWLSRAPAPPARIRVVVLADFQNLTNDPALGTVLGKVLQVDLAQSPHLNLLTRQQIDQTLKQMERPGGTPLTAALAQEVCARNGGDAVLSGTVARAGALFLVTLEAIDCRLGRDIVATKGNAKHEDQLPGSLDDLAVKMREGLQESGDSIRDFDVPIAQATTSSFEALKAYSLGEQLRIHGDNAAALPFYKHAIELDPSFALAYEQLGNAYFGLRETELGKANYQKAFDFKARTSEREKLGITANYFQRLGNAEEAVRAYRLLTQTYPQDWSPWANLANLLTGIARYPEAVAAGREALRLNPLHYGPYSVLARALKRSTRFAEAMAVCRLATARGFDNWDVHGLMYEIAFAQDDAATMAAAVAKEKGKPTETWMLDYEAWAAATEGRVRQSRVLFERAIEIAREQGADSAEDAATFTEDYITAVAVLDSEEEAHQLALGRMGADKGEYESFALAMAGDYADAENAAAALAKRFPRSTEVNDADVPTTLAVVALGRGKPDEAVGVLEPALTSELRDFWTPWLLGRAYLELKVPFKAAVEFRKILANRGVDGTSPLYPLAWLGLARALNMQGSNAESRRAYERLFAFWKNADPDLPVLLEARAEYSKL